MSMIRWCRQNDRPWKLVYAVRSRQRTAYYEELNAVGHEFLQFHIDDEAGEVLNVTMALDDLASDEQVYCCGPAPLMTAVANATSDRPAGSVHFEWFNAGSVSPASSGQNSDMTLELRRSNITLEVPGHQSILEAIEAAGIDHPFSCREGACATCETKVLEGAIDHRDFVLSEEQRSKGDAMMICVSRAADGHLVLDL
ncbi:iron-sulfur cluster-binding domain-containing protein [Aquicoccus sp. G2-2]|uniref:flavin reductase family protein n=1 Tax=Aquicoccus sp. G2-2 TaxID=3092120 RepID=UPI002AE0231B|nr:iron-sulfur cluster-binding domain-containing protein [Aquicoccus sp. G2-2]MEA1114792.1 iron-sulfur cluster-binding domain-containing protein [Aquicoccus sp. G2-2]